MCVKAKVRCWAVVLVLLFSSVAWPGVVYTIDTTDHPLSKTSIPGGMAAYGPAVPKADTGPQKSTVTIEAQGKNLAMTIAENGKPQKDEMVFRADKREMVVVDHQDKSYMIVDSEKVKQMGQRAGAMAPAVDMEEILKKVPPEQRAMVAEMMKKQMPATPTSPTKDPAELKKTADTKVINGWPTTRYDVMQAGKKRRELWVTDWSKIEGGDEVAEAFGALSEFFDEMLKAMPTQAGGANFGGQDMFEHLKELKGFPVCVKEFSDSGMLESESTLRSAKKRTLAPADFEPPAGYKRRMMFPGQ